MCRPLAPAFVYSRPVGPRGRRGAGGSPGGWPDKRLRDAARVFSALSCPPFPRRASGRRRGPFVCLFSHLNGGRLLPQPQPLSYPGDKAASGLRGGGSPSVLRRLHRITLLPLRSAGATAASAGPGGEACGAAGQRAVSTANAAPGARTWRGGGRRRRQVPCPVSTRCGVGPARPSPGRSVRERLSGPACPSAEDRGPGAGTGGGSSGARLRERS